jgi:hypothetical protein
MKYLRFNEPFRRGRLAVGISTPSPAIAARSLRRWPTEVTPMLIKSSAVSCGSTSASISRCRGMQARIVRAPARAATPLRPCADPRLRGAAVPHRRGYSSVPRPASASALQYAPSRVSPLRAGNDCFRAWASQAGEIGNDGFPPTRDARLRRSEWPLRDHDRQGSPTRDGPSSKCPRRSPPAPPPAPPPDQPRVSPSPLTSSSGPAGGKC